MISQILLGIMLYVSSSAPSYVAVLDNDGRLLSNIKTSAMVTYNLAITCEDAYTDPLPTGVYILRGNVVGSLTYTTPTATRRSYFDLSDGIGRLVRVYPKFRCKLEKGQKVDVVITLTAKGRGTTDEGLVNEITFYTSNF